MTQLEKSFFHNDLGCLREDFHKLKGTGKTYGFPEISELSEVVERVLIDRPQTYSQVVPEAIGILSDIYRALATSRSFDLASDGRFREIRALTL